MSSSNISATNISNYGNQLSYSSLCTDSILTDKKWHETVKNCFTFSINEMFTDVFPKSKFILWKGSHENEEQKSQDF